MKIVKVTQVKSAIDRPKSQKSTLRALGLKRMNQTVEVKLNDATQGMIQKINHLVVVEE